MYAIRINGFFISTILILSSIIATITIIHENAYGTFLPSGDELIPKTGMPPSTEETEEEVADEQSTEEVVDEQSTEETEEVADEQSQMNNQLKKQKK